MAPATMQRPKPAASIAEIRKMGYEGETQRQVTNGWYCRGKGDPFSDEWKPLPGLPSDVLVLLPMGAPYERELYPDKGMKPLSVVKNKRSVAGRGGRNPFNIETPPMEAVEYVLALLWERRDEAKAIIQVELDEIAEELGDTSGLMKGEARQLRKKRAVLEQRKLRLDDPKEFSAPRFFRAFAEERRGVLKAQMRPEAQRQAELERELSEWGRVLDALPEDEPTEAQGSTGSRSSRTATSKSGASGEES